jgi:hypothetical protein
MMVVLAVPMASPSVGLGDSTLPVVDLVPPGNQIFTGADGGDASSLHLPPEHE